MGQRVVAVEKYRLKFDKKDITAICICVPLPLWARMTVDDAFPAVAMQSLLSSERKHSRDSCRHQLLLEELSLGTKRSSASWPNEFNHGRFIPFTHTVIGTARKS